MQTPRQSSKLQTKVHIISHPNCEVFLDTEVLSDANLLVRERVNMEFQQNDLGLRMGHTQLHGISGVYTKWTQLEESPRLSSNYHGKIAIVHCTSTILRCNFAIVDGNSTILDGKRTLFESLFPPFPELNPPLLVCFLVSTTPSALHAPGFVTFPRGQCADGGPRTGGAKHGSTLEFWWKQLENPMVSPPLNPGSIDTLTGYKHGNQTWLAPSLSSMVFSYRCQWLVRGFPSKPCS